MNFCPALNQPWGLICELSVTAQRSAFEPLNLPVLSPEMINAPHVFPVTPVTVIETIQELSTCSVYPSVSNSELSVLPISVKELNNERSVHIVSTHESVSELSVCPLISSNMSDFEQSVQSQLAHTILDCQSIPNQFRICL